MPLYEFRCTACGSVDRWVPVERVGDLQQCEACAAPLVRVFSAPSRRMDATRSAAGDVHERSRHEPERVSLPSHSHSHRASPNARPWQLSH